MSIPFSDSSGNTGIVQQTRFFMRVDSSQWSAAKIANSCNNWHDFLTGYLIGADKRFQWDDTNHTKLPEGTTDLTLNQSDFSFLVDEQGNPIVTLIGVSILQNGYYVPIIEADRNDPDIDVSTFGMTTGIPTMYDKIADNIIRLNFKLAATIPAGLKFYFQRTGSYFVATDTTKSPGTSPLLNRGYIIASAYDGAMTLGLKNLQALAVERAQEEQKAIRYFEDRNRDTVGRMDLRRDSNK